MARIPARDVNGAGTARAAFTVYGTKAESRIMSSLGRYKPSLSPIGDLGGRKGFRPEAASSISQKRACACTRARLSDTPSERRANGMGCRGPRRCSRIPVPSNRRFGWVQGFLPLLCQTFRAIARNALRLCLTEVGAIANYRVTSR